MGQSKYGKEIPRAPFYRREPVESCIQMEAVECGAASLSMILSHYGKHIPLEELRIETGVTRDGVSVLGILAAAQRYGLLAEAHLVDLKEAYELPLPFIAYWEFKHFVVIEGFSRDAVYINDPAIGAYTITYDQFSRSFTGVLCLFDTAADFVKTGRQITALEIILDLVHRAKTPFFYAFLTGVCLVVPGLAVPAFTQVFIDNILVNHIYSWEGWFFFVMALTFILTLVFKFLQLRVISRLYIQLSTAFSSEFLFHILRLPYFFYLSRFTGEIANRMLLTDSIARTISTGLTALVIDAIVAIVFALAMFYYDFYIALFGLVIVAADVAVMLYLYRNRESAYYYYQQTAGRSLGFSIAALRSIESVKVSGLEDSFFSTWSGYYTKTLNALQNIGRNDIYAGALPDFLKSLSLIMILAFGSWRVIHGHLTIGMLMALLILMENFTRPITRLANFNQIIQLLKVDTNRVNDVLNNPVDPTLVNAEENEELLSKEVPYSKLKGSVELKNITFGFDRSADPLLKNINLKVSPGSYVGIVGSTGSGKSTLSKILTGLIAPWEGEVLFDHKRRDQMPRSLIINSMSVVEQKDNLFYGTVKDNISFFNPLISQEVIVQAAKDACIHDVILARKGGYDLKLQSSASNLSGGERQRIEIARAFANEPTILVLDEATSALDTDTEKQLMTNIRHRGCTCFIIAHRLSTTRYCDEIIVLDKGSIVQRGTPDELSRTPGIYKELIDLEKSKKETL